MRASCTYKLRKATSIVDTSLWFSWALNFALPFCTRRAMQTTWCEERLALWEPVCGEQPLSMIMRLLMNFQTSFQEGLSWRDLCERGFSFHTHWTSTHRSVTAAHWAHSLHTKLHIVSQSRKEYFLEKCIRSCNEAVKVHSFVSLTATNTPTPSLHESRG